MIADLQTKIVVIIFMAITAWGCIGIQPYIAGMGIFPYLVIGWAILIALPSVFYLLYG